MFDLLGWTYVLACILAARLLLSASSSQSLKTNADTHRTVSMAITDRQRRYSIV